MHFQNRNSSGKNYIPVVLADAPMRSTPGGSHVSYGPDSSRNPFPHQTGNAARGREVFRFETFGNEGFWTDAMRLPKGMMDAKFTPLDALKAGLHVDIERVPPDLSKALAKELKTDLSPENAPLLNDPATTVKLINANAVIGVVPRDTNRDMVMRVDAGDKVGIACAICHTITDESVYAMRGKGLSLIHI